MTEREVDRGPVVHRFEGSLRDLRALAYVRGACALMAFGGSLMMLLGRLNLQLFLVALLGLVMSLVWLRQARVALRRSRTAKPPALVIHRAGVALEDGARKDFLAFADIAGFEVDEERLDVRVLRRDGSATRIEPQYQGVDLHQLVRTLQDALRASGTEEVGTGPATARSGASVAGRAEGAVD